MKLLNTLKSKKNRLNSIFLENSLESFSKYAKIVLDKTVTEDIMALFDIFKKKKKEETKGKAQADTAKKPNDEKDTTTETKTEIQVKNDKPAQASEAKVASSEKPKEKAAAPATKKETPAKSVKPEQKIEAKPANDEKAKNSEKPAAKTAPKAEPKAEAKPATDKKIKAAEKPAAKAAPKSESKAEAKTESKPETKIESKPEEKAEATETKGYTGRFEINKSKDGKKFFFNLYASNKVGIATSQMYSTAQSALIGIKSVIANAAEAPVEDQTLKKYDTLPFPKWEIYIDNGGKYRFRLNASNGSCVCHSQGYTTKTACKNGIDSIIRSSRNAEIDKTYITK